MAKLNDAESEACETQVWIEFAHRCGCINEESLNNLDNACNQIIGQLVKMIQEADKWLIKQSPPRRVPECGVVSHLLGYGRMYEHYQNKI